MLQHLNTLGLRAKYGKRFLWGLATMTTASAISPLSARASDSSFTNIQASTLVMPLPPGAVFLITIFIVAILVFTLAPHRRT